MQEPAPARKAGCLARGLAFVLASLLVIALPLSLLALDVWRVVFNADLIKHLLTDEVVNSDLVPVALEWFSDRRAEQRVREGIALTGVDEPDMVLLLSFMERNSWRAVRAEVLTDEFLTHLVSVSVDGTYQWIDSENVVPQVTYDLRQFINRVNSEHGTNSVVIAYDQLDACTEEEIADFLARLAAAPPGSEVLYNLCEFPDPWHDDQFSDYENALFKVVENVPPEFALTDELAQTVDQQGVGPEAIKRQLRLIRLVGMWAWLAPLPAVSDPHKCDHHPQPPDARTLARLSLSRRRFPGNTSHAGLPTDHHKCAGRRCLERNAGPDSGGSRAHNPAAG